MEMTRKVALSTAIAALSTDSANDEVVAVLTNMLTSLENVKSKPSKADLEKKAANEVIKGKLLSALEDIENKVSVADIRKMPEFADLSSPKVSALLTQLVAEGKVSKTLEKRTNFYTVAVGE